MKVRGPKGAMVYTPNMVRRFGMIAGGTGITPMLQVAQAIRRGRKSGDKTQVDLIFANVNEEDILLREDLDDLNKEEGFNVYYVLNNPPEGWTGGVGFVTADMIKVCFIEDMLIVRMLISFFEGTSPSSSQGRQDPHLWTSTHGLCRQEGYRVSWL